MTIDFNSETWLAVATYARQTRAKALEDLCDCPLDQVERLRGVIVAMDEVLALPRLHGLPGQDGSADIY